MGSELAVMESNAGELMRRATDAAGVCGAIVRKTAKRIGPKEYVQVEGWQAIATTFGCVISTRDVQEVEGGVRAIGEVRRMSDGAVIATAEGFVGKDEPTWYGGKDKWGKEVPPRPMFAVRAMAQTRAQSRAGRAAFAFVVVLIDAGLSTTPAEEMEGIYGDAPQGPVSAAPAVEAAKQAVKAKRLNIVDAPAPKAPVRTGQASAPPPDDAPPPYSDEELARFEATRGGAR